MKPSVLIIPENYPTDLQPNGGVFMDDQVSALSQVSDIAVFNTNPWYRGLYRQSGNARYYDFHLFSRKWVAPFNLMAYAWWERQSIRMAKQLPRPDMIHLHGAALRGNMALTLARHWKIPLVLTEHTGPWSAISARKMVFKKAKAAMESADIVLPVSQHLSNEILESGITPVKIQVIGNPVDTDFFKLRNARLPDAKSMLFLGRLDVFKGAMRTLKAFHSVHDQLSGWSLTIAGEGEEATEIQTYIEMNHLEAVVNFEEGFFSRETMRDFFYRASFLVFPSAFESFGLVGAEAMATGLPVLITDRTGPKDYFAKGCGLQTDPMDVDAIARGMVKMASEIDAFDPDFIRKHISEKFGFAAHAESMRMIYSGLIS